MRLSFRTLFLGLLGAGVLAIAGGAQPPRLRPIRPEGPQGLPDKEVAKLQAARGRLLKLQEVLRGAWNPTLGSIQPPLFFETNQGQADGQFQFVLRSVGFAAGFSQHGMTAVVLSPPGAGSKVESPPQRASVLRWSFLDSRGVKPSGLDQLKGSVNLAHGADRSRWLQNVPAYAALAYNDLYPGIQLIARGTQGRLEYGLVLEPAASLADVKIAVEGATKLEVDRSGNLRMVVRGGRTIVQTRPRFVESDAAGARGLKGRFKVLGPGQYGFEVIGQRTPGARLLVDPEIVFASYFGGSDDEGTLEPDLGATDIHRAGFDLATGADGHLYVVGTTASPDFPATGGTMQGITDAVVMRLNPQAPPGQQLVYATFLGGSDFERGVSLAPREDGAVYVAGCSTSSDFPDPGSASRSVGYVVRLTPEGLFDIGRRIGTSMDHHVSSVAFSRRPDEPAGFVYVAGTVMPRGRAGAGDATPGAFQTEVRGSFDGFVVKLDADLAAPQYFTYLGGTGQDRIFDLAVNDGFAFVTGSTSSVDFPTTELVTQPAHSQASTGVDCATGTARQCFDAFVTRIARDGGSLHYSTFLGGGREEFGRGIAVSNNQATVTGAARSTADTTSEIFVTRLESSAENPIWNRSLSAQGSDHGEAVLVDPLGRAHVVGTVSVDGLGTADSFHGGASDIFYARLAAATGEVEYSTYLGGNGVDRGFGVTAQGTSADSFCAMLAGSTTSQDIETVNPLQGGETNRGRADLLLFALCDIEPEIDGSGFTKTVDPQILETGETLRYTITLVNGGDSPGPVTVRDEVPSALTVTGVTGPGCTRNGNVVTCAMSAPPGATSIVITARAGNQCPRTVTNNATLQVGARQFTSQGATVQIACIPPPCGNGRLDPGEQCDGTPGCRSDCTPIVCGDGFRDAGERCDDGDRNDDDECTNACVPQIVGRAQCSSDGPRCAGNFVCGKSCAVAECVGGHSFFGFCIGGDDVLLCDAEYHCMPSSEATYTAD